MDAHRRLGGGGGVGGGAEVTPPLSGHAAVGVLRFAAAALWLGGLVLLGTCALPHTDEGLLATPPGSA